ncbi:MAG: acyl-CoA dehydrogenase family protein [Adlercreutzia equolifaciens]
MDFTLTDGQKKLVSAFRTFGADTFTPERVAKWCRDQGLPDTVMKEFVDLYYETAEPDIAPDLAHSLLSQVLIVEELSRCAGTTLPFQNDLFNLQIMSGFAGAAEAASIAEDYRADGRLMFALAISEPDGGSDTMAMKTSCQTVDGRLLLNGRKSYVNNGEYAPYILVAAIDKDAGDTGRYPSLSFWLVPRSVPGINAVPISKIGQSMLPFALISFDDVELSPEWRLDASEGVQKLSLLEWTCAVRLQFGWPGAMDDAAQRSRRPRCRWGAADRDPSHRYGSAPAHMRSMVYRAAWSIDAADETERLDVALMKRYVPEASVQVASDAMQILGGLGYTEGSRVSRIWEDCRGNQIAEGTDQVMVYIAAPLIMEHYRSF